MKDNLRRGFTLRKADGFRQPLSEAFTDSIHAAEYKGGAEYIRKGKKYLLEKYGIDPPFHQMNEVVKKANYDGQEKFAKNFMGKIKEPIPAPALKFIQPAFSLSFA